MIRPRFRLLLIEDSQHRIDIIRSWLPGTCLLVVAASAGKAIGILQRDPGYVYGAVMLDHDLNEQAVTDEDLTLSGSDLIESLIKHLSRNVPIMIHSMNSFRAPALVKKLKGAGFNAQRVRFSEIEEEQKVFLNWLNEARCNWAYEHGVDE